MNKRILFGACLLLVFRICTADPEKFMAHGILVDVHCYALKQSSTNATCPAPGASPVALLDRTAQTPALYILATPPTFLTDHLGKTARVTGEQSELRPHLVKPDLVEVKEGEGWAEVQLLPEM